MAVIVATEDGRWSPALIPRNMNTTRNAHAEWAKYAPASEAAVGNREITMAPRCWTRLETNPAASEPSNEPKAPARKIEPPWAAVRTKRGSALMAGIRGEKMKRDIKVMRKSTVMNTMVPTTVRSGWGVGQALATTSLLV